MNMPQLTTVFLTDSILTDELKRDTAQDNETPSATRSHSQWHFILYQQQHCRFHAKSYLCHVWKVVQSFPAVGDRHLGVTLGVTLGQKVGEVDEGPLEALEWRQQERAHLVVDASRGRESNPGLQATAFPGGLLLRKQDLACINQLLVAQWSVFLP